MMGLVRQNSPISKFSQSRVLRRGFEWRYHSLLVAWPGLDVEQQEKSLLRGQLVWPPAPQLAAHNSKLAVGAVSDEDAVRRGMERYGD